MTMGEFIDQSAKELAEEMAHELAEKMANELAEKMTKEAEQKATECERSRILRLVDCMTQSGESHLLHDLKNNADLLQSMLKKYNLQDSEKSNLNF